VGSALLTVVAGLIGNQDPTRNIAMDLFSVIFLLGFGYLTLFIGDLYALINPWKWGVEQVEGLGFNLTMPRFTYPNDVGCWPAFVLYLGLIWLELFVRPQPYLLTVALLMYSAITLIGVIVFGRVAWFAQGDLFSIYFRLIGKLAPIEYRAIGHGPCWQFRFRSPFVAAINEQSTAMSVVLFVLLMLSSTTYDAIHGTALWTRLYWSTLLWSLQPLWAQDLGKAQHLLMGGYLVYLRAGLLLFPFLYLGTYLFVLKGVKFLTWTTLTLRTLALRFAYSLIPIAVAYNFAHYCAFLLVEVRNLPSRISDPFGLGWNLLGIMPGPSVTSLQMSTIWHIQVGVLILGHVIGVYLAHEIALRTFPGRRRAIVSQVPILALMLIYTTLGLWVLSLPLGWSG
jgi:hypothetical protein